MRLRNIVDDDSAVSPVIGVILMVAITVILAAVIASFVLGLGPSEAAPQAQFDWESDSSSNTVTISHTSGDTLQGDNIYIRGDLNGADSEVNWGSPGSVSGYDSGGGQTEISSGDSITVLTDTNDDWSLSVVWEQDDQSSELASQSA